MTECQGCGAWNDTSRTLCVLCGTPLAETDEWESAAEPPPLPPLPDGGLAATMPAWLREPPRATPRASPPPSSPAPAAVLAAAPAAPPPDLDLVPHDANTDPRTFLTDDDFPQWLRALAAREAGGEGKAERGSRDARKHERVAWPAWRPEMTPPLPTAVAHNPAAARQTGLPGEPAAATRPEVAANAMAVDHPPPATMPAPPHGERRRREGWQTFLLVILVLGLLVAALWALASYGLFSVKL